MTASYTQSRNAVINGALRVLGVIGAGVPTQAQHSLIFMEVSGS